MGYTSFTIEKIEGILATHHANTVIDLGAQNNYSQPQLPAPYMSDWYMDRVLYYASVDINGENQSIPIDLSWPVTFGLFGFSESFCAEQGATRWEMSKADLLVDAGTSEHVGRNGTFDWEAIYNCWKTKYDLLKPGGIMYNENPKTGNWPGHGFQYYTELFYKELVTICSSLTIIDCDTHPAMGNTTDGWNVWAILQKTSDGSFITLEEFKTLDLRLK